MSIMYPTCEGSVDTETLERKPAARGKDPATGMFEFDPIKDPRWSALTDFHPDATVFHRVEWLQALRDCYGYEPRALSFTPPGSPLSSGFVFCRIRSSLTGNRIVSLPFSDHCEPLVSCPEEFDLLLSHVHKMVGCTGLKYVEVRPLTTHSRFRDSFGTSHTYYLHRLDLQPAEQSLFKSFHKDSVQRKIRRAEREHLRYEEGCSDVLLNCFYRLLIMTRRRQGLPPQPRKWFQSVLARRGQKAKIRVAFKEDRPIASILTMFDKKTMVYKYGCSDARFNNLGGTALLFWKTIQEAKANGLKEFDLGRSDIDNVGLVTFKEHWGAKRSTINYWRYPAPTAVSSERAIKYVKGLISVAPDRALIMLGNLFYRHIG